MEKRDEFESKKQDTILQSCYSAAVMIVVIYALVFAICEHNLVAVTVMAILAIVAGLAFYFLLKSNLAQMAEIRSEIKTQIGREIDQAIRKHKLGGG